MRKYAVKGLYLLIIGFCYLFSKGLLTKFLYPLENKYHLYWMVGPGKIYNIIDCNIPHIIVFIGFGMLFKWWGFVLVFLLEIFQKLVKGDFALIDIGLNSAGLLIGISIIYVYEKIRKKPQNKAKFKAQKP